MMSIHSLSTHQPYDFFGRDGVGIDDMLFKIYGDLPLQDKLALGRTSQRLYYLFQNNVIWRPLLSQDVGEQLPVNSGPTDAYMLYKMSRIYHENMVARKWVYKELLNCGEEISCFYKHENLVYTGSCKGEVKVWDLDQQKEICTLCCLEEPIDEIQVKGKFLGTLSSEYEDKVKKMTVWDLEANAQVFSKEKTSFFRFAENCLYFQSSPNSIQVLNLNTLEEEEGFQSNELNCWDISNHYLYVHKRRERQIEIFFSSDQKLEKIDRIDFPSNLVDSIDWFCVDKGHLYLLVQKDRDSKCQIWDLSQPVESFHFEFLHVLKHKAFIGNAGHIYEINPTNKKAEVMCIANKKTHQMTLPITYPIQPQGRRIWNCSEGILAEWDFGFPCQSIYPADVLKQNLEVVKILGCLAKYQVQLNEDSLNEQTSQLHLDFLKILHTQTKRFGKAENDGFFSQKALISTHVLILIELAFHALYLNEELDEKKLLRELFLVAPEAIRELLKNICFEIAGHQLQSLDEFYKYDFVAPGNRLRCLQKLKSWCIDYLKD